MRTTHPLLWLQSSPLLVGNNAMGFGSGDFRGDTFYPFQAIWILSKIRRGVSKASRRNKYSAQLTPHEPFTRSGGESCVFNSNLFLIRPLPRLRPRENGSETCHLPSTAVLSMRLMSAASTNSSPCCFSLWCAWRLDFAGPRHSRPRTFESLVVFFCCIFFFSPPIFFFSLSKMKDSPGLSVSI